jgi:hypothetical protein
MYKPTVSEVVELAMEAAKEDPIDFGYLTIDEESSYNLVALSLMEREEFFDEKTGMSIMLACLTKLLVENMVLNLKLRWKDK